MTINELFYEINFIGVDLENGFVEEILSGCYSKFRVADLIQLYELSQYCFQDVIIYNTALLQPYYFQLPKKGGCFYWSNFFLDY